MPISESIICNKITLPSRNVEDLSKVASDPTRTPNPVCEIMKQRDGQKSEEDAVTYVSLGTHPHIAKVESEPYEIPAPEQKEG